MNASRVKLFAAAALLVALFLGVQRVHGSGFALQEQSVSHLGNAFAGQSANPEDASTIFFNPAGLVGLPSQAVVGLHAILGATEFSNSGSLNNAGGLQVGDEGGDAAGSAFIPNLYASFKTSEKLALGLGVNVPFGLATRFEETWVGRYQGIKTKLETTAITPTVSFQASEKLALGAGISYVTADAKLTNAVDFGAIGFANGIPGRAPGTDDGHVRLTGDGDALAYNLGLLIEPAEKLRLGLAYRSRTHIEIDGDAEFQLTAATTALAGTFPASTGGTARIDLPETISAGVAADTSEQLTLMADAAYTRWSRFEHLLVDFDNATTPDSFQPERFQPTWRVGLGANYRLDARVTFRGGLAYDQSPIQHDLRTPRIPGNDRTWLSLGAGYAINDANHVDFGWAHIFIADAGLQRNETPSEGAVFGSFASSADILSLQYRYSF